MNAAASSSRGAPAILFEGVEKRFDDGALALSGVDLRVGRGEFLALIGPSGCGKSTLLSLAAGLTRPTAGRIDRPLAGGGGPTPRIGFVFQDPTLMPWARAATNVRLPLDLAGAPRAEADRRARAALARVGLEGVADKTPRRLSGGMRMRVAIARALVDDPALLLMDEPFAALDEIARSRLDEELSALWSESRPTTLFVTHSVAEAAFLATRVVVMAPRPGRIVAERVIDAPHPRTRAYRDEERFAAHAKALSAALFGATESLT